MKKTTYLLLNLILWTSSGLSQNTMNIDFGVSSMTTQTDAEGSLWNNAVWGGAGDKSPLLVENRNTFSMGITMQRLSGFLGAYGTGENSQKLFPVSAAKDRWSLERGKSDKGVLRFSKLKPNQYMTIHFYGIRDAPVEFLTRYAAQGQQVVLNCQNNRDQMVALKDLRPDANGNIDIEVSIASGPNGHLSAAIVQLYESKPNNYQPPSTPGTGVSVPTPAPAPAPPAVAQPAPATPPAPPATPPAAPEAGAEPGEAQEVNELAELGLEDEGSNTVLMVTGVILIVLGLGVIIASVWYFLKPESE